MSTFLSRALSPQDPYTTSTTRDLMLGTPGVTPDGRKYRYARAGEAHTAGLLQAAAVIVANHVDLTPSAAAVGDYDVTVTLGATLATADQYQDGFLVCHTTPGHGRSYRIVGHPAAASGGTLVVRLAQPIEVALTSSSRVTLMKNPYDALVVCPTTLAQTPLGIPNVAVANNEYYWLQTGGPCSARAGATITIAKELAPDNGSAGSVEAWATAGDPNIGSAIQAGVSGESRQIFLRLDPG